MLTDCSLPLSSFSFIGILGSAGTGKSYTMFKIADAYKVEALKHPY